MDDAAMLWGDAMGLCYHRSIASPHRSSHRLIVHRIASSSIASPHSIASSSIASPHRPSHRLIVIASPQRQCEPSRPSYPRMSWRRWFLFLSLYWQIMPFGHITPVRMGGGCRLIVYQIFCYLKKKRFY